MSASFPDSERVAELLKAHGWETSPHGVVTKSKPSKLPDVLVRLAERLGREPAEWAKKLSPSVLRKLGAPTLEQPGPDGIGRIWKEHRVLPRDARLNTATARPLGKGGDHAGLEREPDPRPRDEAGRFTR